MDIFERLNREHAAVSRRFERLEAHREEARENHTQLFSSLRDELMIHLLAEQEIFYNALLERLDDQDLLLEAFEDHTVVEGLLDDIERSGIRDPRFGARVSELKLIVEQHVAHEESVIFEIAREHLAPDEANALGAQLEARRKEIP
jgi:hypothetical protein